MAKGKSTAFSLEGFRRNPDGSYTKISSPQPRAVVKTVLEPTSIEFDSGKSKVKQKKQEQVYFCNMDIQDVYAQCEREGVIFIPKNVPSLKNSKQLFKNNKTGKTFITSSEYCKKYVIDTELHYRLFTSKFHELIRGKEKPYRIQLFFVREDHSAFDYINISQMVFDLMQKYNWIAKDDNRNVIPNFDCGYGYDKKLPGVIIKVL
jgi:hypothetical protein